MATKRSEGEGESRWLVTHRARTDARSVRGATRAHAETSCLHATRTHATVWAPSPPAAGDGAQGVRGGEKRHPVIGDGRTPLRCPLLTHPTHPHTRTPF